MSLTFIVFICAWSLAGDILYIAHLNIALNLSICFLTLCLNLFQERFSAKV